MGLFLLTIYDKRNDFAFDIIVNFLFLDCDVLVALLMVLESAIIIEPRREKTGLRDFRPGPTQTGLYSHRSKLEA